MRQRERKASQLERVKLPELIVIPAGTKPARCGCGMDFYFAKNANGKTTAVSVAPTFKTRDGKTVEMLGCRAPSDAVVGMGFDHHIDCSQREQYRKAGGKLTSHLPASDRVQPPSPEESARKIKAAETLSEQFKIRCTGGGSPDECNGFAVVVFLLGRRMLATPCSAHADHVVSVVGIAGRSRDLVVRPVNEFLVEGTRLTTLFVAKQQRVRDWYRGYGVTPDSIKGVDRIE